MHFAEMKNTYKILVEKLEGKGPLGRVLLKSAL
jgi:hypothetical protein